MADSLPDETILIRGGENKVTDVKKAAEEAASTSDEGHVLSGNADPSLDLDWAPPRRATPARSYLQVHCGEGADGRLRGLSAHRKEATCDHRSPAVTDG